MHYFIQLLFNISPTQTVDLGRIKKSPPAGREGLEGRSLETPALTHWIYSKNVKIAVSMIPFNGPKSGINYSLEDKVPFIMSYPHVLLLYGAQRALHNVNLYFAGVPEHPVSNLLMCIKQYKYENKKYREVPATIGDGHKVWHSLVRVCACACVRVYVEEKVY